VKYRLLQLRWRLALWSVVYPVQIALVVALAILAIPVTMLLNAQADLRKAQRDIEAGQRASQRNQVEIQRSRVAVTKDICAQLDRNARTSNAQLKSVPGHHRRREAGPDLQ
jgi:type II secretory pathway component PulJ